MKALLFDLDGTLIDSMPHHQSAWNAWSPAAWWPRPPLTFQ